MIAWKQYVVLLQLIIFRLTGRTAQHTLIYIHIPETPPGFHC